MDDAFAHFVAAQAPVMARVEAELAAGRKTSHWMWFVLPQLKGLGSSPMAQKFALASRAEATAYLAHPLLGSRLRHCTGLVNAVAGRTVHRLRIGPLPDADTADALTARIERLGLGVPRVTIEH